MAGQILVYGSLRLAFLARIPPYFIALTVIGIGSALPDFIVGLSSVRKKHQEIGVGDVIGSTVIEFLLFLGLVALIKPIEVDFFAMLTSAVFLIVSMALLLYFVKRKEISWKQGLIFILIYALFIATEVYKI